AAAAATRLVPGIRLAEGTPAPLEVIASPARDGRGAILRATCNDGGCALGGTPIAAGRRIDLHAPGSGDAIGFVVDDLRVDAPWAQARVRIYGFGEVLDLIKPGDLDTFLDSEYSLRPPPGV